MTCPPSAPPAVPAPDPFLRACLVRLLHEVAADKKGLASFNGALWLTYQVPGKRRLIPYALSGSIPPGLLGGATFPEMIGTMATTLANRHGQVLCHSLIGQGFSGVVSIGHAVNFEEHSRHVLGPRPTLVGVIVQLDGPELILALDPAVGVAQPPMTETGLHTLVANTWAIAETIHNMAAAPMPSDAAELAQEIIDIEPGLLIGPGSKITMSGTHIAGSPSQQAASRFLARATAAAKADTAQQGPPAPEIPAARPRRRVSLVTPQEITNAMQTIRNSRGVVPLRVAPRTYRNVD